MRAFARCLSGYGFVAFTVHHPRCSCACRRCTLREARRRWNAAPLSPILPRCVNSIVADLASCGCWLHRKPPAARSTTALCSRCLRWRRFDKSLDEEFERYVQRHKAELPNDTIGVGTQFDFQLFDRDQLYSQADRFVLAGIVNRMDRAYVSPRRLRRNPPDLSPHGDRCAAGRRSRRPRRGCR